jgi:hypothetical protein
MYLTTKELTARLSAWPQEWAVLAEGDYIVVGDHVFIEDDDWREQLEEEIAEVAKNQQLKQELDKLE